ncbi:AAA family ATPase [Paracoccus caeni]|uniref:AAA family ATPase n=1 Tax=Paracoccus caeni TaxID=657651 RepID=A0A934SI74_9RHOB|nr:AAA family ATPase [Paracoccus caeni]MBK4217944.1 AAA family ATPase [Paracoccus caeni]
MPTWLAHYRSVVASLDVGTLDPQPQAEMSPEVFSALVEGRLSDVEEELEDLPAWGEPETPRRRLADDPMRAIALAALCRAFPTRTAFAAMTGTGAVTVLQVTDSDMVVDIKALLTQVLGDDDRRRKVALTCLPAPEGSGAASTASKMQHALNAISRGTTPHVLIIEAGASLPVRIARMLPEPIRLGPPDRSLIAAALSLRGDGYSAIAAKLPTDAALRQLPAAGLRFALRHRIRETQLAELQRLTRALRPSNGPTLDDIGGYGAAEDAARQLVGDLKAWAAGQIGWSEMTRSVLFHGPPGTGKTWLARAIAASAGVPLIQGSLSAWQAAGHLGQMLREMRATFAEAQAAAPCVLFLDEIDGAGDRKSPDRHAENYRRQVINALLELLDGATRIEGVAVVAACNDVDALDAALRRPGRLDRIVRVPLPGRHAIIRVLSHHLRGALDDETITRLAPRLIGKTPADLDAAIRAARGRARGAGRPLALQDIVLTLGLTEEDSATIRRVAVHEAGHAIAITALGRGRIREIHVGPSGGHVEARPPAKIPTRADLIDDIICLLAGRAAEELILGDVSIGSGDGARSDLAQATGIAVRLELAYGLGATGLVYVSDPNPILAADPALRARIDACLQAAMCQATALLCTRRDEVIALADRLCVERVIEGPNNGLAAQALPEPEDGL